MSPLPPGEYTLQATAPGFQSLTQEKITVDALATVALDLTLKLGSAAEQVTVEAAAPQLRTSDATLGQTMVNKVYNTLPLAMSSGVPRDPTQFIALAPGVAAVVTQSAGPSYTSFNGAQQETNGLYLEGMDDIPNQQGDTRPLALGVSVEAIEQFQVEVNGQKAQYQGQGFHNYQLKSGTNQFHGAAYEYFRNTTSGCARLLLRVCPVGPAERVRRQPGRPDQEEQSLFLRKLHRLLLQHIATAPIFITVPPLAARNGDFSGFAADLRPRARRSAMAQSARRRYFPNNMIPAEPHFADRKVVSVLSADPDECQHHEQLSWRAFPGRSTTTTRPTKWTVNLSATRTVFTASSSEASGPRTTPGNLTADRHGAARCPIRSSPGNREGDHDDRAAPPHPRLHPDIHQQSQCRRRRACGFRSSAPRPTAIICRRLA